VTYHPGGAQTERIQAEGGIQVEGSGIEGKRPSARGAIRLDAGGYRLALLVLLTLLAVVGLHASISQPAWGSHTKALDTQVAGALEAVAVVLFLVVLVRNRGAQDGQPLAMRLRTALLYVLGAGIVALAITLVDLLVNINPHGEAGRTNQATPPRSLPGRLRLPRSASSSASHFPINQVLYGLAAALLVAAIVAISLKAWRQRRLVSGPELEPPAEDYGETLQEAILGGRRALLELDDARAAIIACYAAMEQSLARAGAERSVAETPDELLAKAAGQLLISAGAASRLTSLFYEARFSSHPLDHTQREAAERALAELASELDVRYAGSGAGL
jgi:hypothetical protein